MELSSYPSELIKVPGRGYIVLIRHGERLDNSWNVPAEERKETKVINELDIPLSRLGKEQALTTGKHLLNWF